MNARKLAKALRLAAEALEEDDDRDDKPENDTEAPRPISDIERQNARKKLRRLGLGV